MIHLKQPYQAFILHKIALIIIVEVNHISIFVIG